MFHNFVTIYNNIDLRQIGKTLNDGMATARGLAELYLKAFDGTLISEKIIEVFDKKK